MQQNTFRLIIPSEIDACVVRYLFKTASAAPEITSLLPDDLADPWLDLPDHTGDDGLAPTKPSSDPLPDIFPDGSALVLDFRDPRPDFCGPL